MSSSKNDIKEQASAALDDYLSKFNRRDLAAAAAYYHDPMQVISALSVDLVHGPREMEESFKATMKRLESEGFDHSEWTAPKQIAVLDEKGLVLICCHVSRLKKDGSSLEDLTVTYTLRKSDSQGWQIVAMHRNATGTSLLQ
jgi:ketosteroid isomerase-like protein